RGSGLRRKFRIKALKTPTPTELSSFFVGNSTTMAAASGLNKEGSLADNIRGVFDGALQPGARPCLLIIDFVQAYLKKDSPLYAGVEDALASTKRLLALARRQRLPVVHTRVEFLPGGLDGGIFFRKLPLLKIFEKGSPMGNFHPDVMPLPNEVIVTKQYASAFFGTSLAPTLRAQGVDTVLIAGLSTSGCVRATATDACQHGFIPIVVEDAVGDRHNQVHESNLFDIKAKYAEVWDEEAASMYIKNREQ
ncbi:isochorismatase hydrolase, partial [Nannochloropsis gaditana CCMP526]|uniref:isochorismatase hydrolase n=1 Tax=Nannochloropsis gaditana (strain CCMP526) TaxID=1093141 RepID=UPI00029F7DD1